MFLTLEHGLFSAYWQPPHRPPCKYHKHKHATDTFIRHTAPCYFSGLHRLHWAQWAFSHLCQHIFGFKWIPEVLSSRGNSLHLFIALYPPACQYQRCLSWTKIQRWTFSGGPQTASIKTSQYTLYPCCQGKVEDCNFIYRLCAGADGNLLIAEEGGVGTWEVCKAGRLCAGCITFLSQRTSLTMATTQPGH